MLVSEQDMHRTLTPTVGHHDGMLHQNGRGAHTKGHHITPEELGCRITHLRPGLQGIHSRRPSTCSLAWQGMTHNQAHHHMKLASDRLKTHDGLADCVGYHKGNKM
jgi:hypothetical protein